jgi:hypothetical protein
VFGAIWLYDRSRGGVRVERLKGSVEGALPRA